MVVDTYNTAQRPKSLMELHQEKSSAKPKRKKEGKPSKEGKNKTEKAKAASPAPKQKEDWEGVHPWKVRLHVGCSWCAKCSYVSHSVGCGEGHLLG
jgi:hypothetical protein